uniref:Uncharacterized protein n=1 Tax=Tanacetum cinerariifolium TaxID=118510 RepID=A0A6L2N6B1_TANCI|nr:hypothetical protein [Tanacetum cinerariifolium]
MAVGVHSQECRYATTFLKIPMMGNDSIRRSSARGSGNGWKALDDGDDVNDKFSLKLRLLKCMQMGQNGVFGKPRKGTSVGDLLLLLLKVLTVEGKGIMVDDVVELSVGASRSRSSSGPAPSVRDVFEDAIHVDFFPFSAGPYYATYPECGVAGNCEFTHKEWDDPYRPTFGVLTKEVFKDHDVCKTMVDQFSTPGEMVRVESLSDDQLSAKMSVLHYMMMSHGGELLARYRRLNQSHHEYVLSADSRLKGYEEKVASLTGLELQQVSRLNDKFFSSDASFSKSKAKGKERKKKIKSFSKSLDNLHAKVAHLSANLNQAIVLEAEKDEEILRLKATPPCFSSFFRGQFQGLVQKFLASDEFSRVQGELLSLAASAGFERGLSMHRTKDVFVVVLKKMANFMLGAHDSLVEASPLLLKLTMHFLTRFLSMLLNLYRLSFSLSLKIGSSGQRPPSRDARVSPHITKESTVTPASKSLELSTNVDLTASTIASEHNEEMVNAKVDESNPKMTDDTIAAKSAHDFV